MNKCITSFLTLYLTLIMTACSPAYDYVPIEDRPATSYICTDNRTDRVFGYSSKNIYQSRMEHNGLSILVTDDSGNRRLITQSMRLLYLKCVM